MKRLIAIVACLLLSAVSNAAEPKWVNVFADDNILISLDQNSFSRQAAWVYFDMRTQFRTPQPIVLEFTVGERAGQREDVAEPVSYIESKISIACATSMYKEIQDAFFNEQGKYLTTYSEDTEPIIANPNNMSGIIFTAICGKAPTIHHRT